MEKYGAYGMDDVGFVAMSDAAWAVRADGTSQGGFLILLVPRRALDNEPVHYGILDWRSSKLLR
eukprot:12886703-Prorocentrum_lima.AAC.1